MPDVSNNDEDLPSVPSSVFSHLGPLPVTYDCPEGFYGLTHWDDRKVQLADDLSPMAEWQTYWHEAIHVALYDSGVRLNKKNLEIVCDAVGTYLAAAVKQGFLKVTE